MNKDTLSKLIAELPKDFQLALSLYYCEQLTFKEIATVLNITPQEACTLYSKAYNAVLVKNPSICQSTV